MTIVGEPPVAPGALVAAAQFVTLYPEGSEPVALERSDGSLRIGLEVNWGDTAVELALAEGPDIVGGVVGARRRIVREITLAAQIRGTTPAVYIAAARDLASAVTALERAGGRLTRQVRFQDGSLSELLELTVLSANMSDVADPWLEAHRLFGQVELTITAQPYWLAEETLVGSVSTSSSVPVVIDTPLGGLRGNLPGPGRLVVTDTANYPRRYVEFGGRFTYEGSAPLYDFSLLDLAESAGTAGTDATAIGGSHVRVLPLLPVWQPVAQINNQSLRGGFRCRIRSKYQGEDARVTQRLMWRPNGGIWREAGSSRIKAPEWWDTDVGAIHHFAEEGQTVDLRVDVYADAIDLVDGYLFDCLQVMPTEVYGVARGIPIRKVPKTTSCYDEFSEIVDGVGLNGRVDKLGNTWQALGSATGFLGVASEGTVSRQSSDNVARYALATGTDFSAIESTVAFEGYLTYSGAKSTDHQLGPFIRLTDTNNSLRAVLRIRRRANGDYMGTVAVFIRVAGVETKLAEIDEKDAKGVKLTTLQGGVPRLKGGLMLTVDADGSWELRCGKYDRSLIMADRLAHGVKSSLETGGALANGGGGVYNKVPVLNASTSARFRSSVFYGSAAMKSTAPAVRAGGTGEIDHLGARSAELDGSEPQEVAHYQGSRLWMPGGVNGAVAVKVRFADIERQADDGVSIPGIDVDLYHRPAFATFSGSLA